MDSPNVIILDEPTNDLDIQTLRILEDYLDSFPGIILTVSHDRYFLDRVVTRIFSFEGSGVILQSEGGYSDYVVRKKADRDGSDNSDKSGKGGGSGKSGSGAQQGGGSGKAGSGAQQGGGSGKAGGGASQGSSDDASEKSAKGYRPVRVKTKLSYAEQKEYDNIESEIEELENKCKEVEKQIALSTTDFTRLMQLENEKAELEATIEAKMERYIELQEMVDSFASK